MGITKIAAALLAGTAALMLVGASRVASEPSEALDQAGSVVLAQQPEATIPDGYAPSESACDATLAEVQSRLPHDYGTAWFWSSGAKDWAGLYFPGRNIIVMSSDIECEYVPIVATHEWMHRVQDVSGLQDQTEVVPGTQKLEIVAECAARAFAVHEGWPYFGSYPEATGIPCSEVSADVQALLATI